MPQRLATSSVHGFKRAAIVSEENQAASRGHDSAAGVSPPDLRVLPYERICVEAVGEKNLLRFFCWNPFYACRVISLSFLKGLCGLRKISLAFFQRQDIQRVSEFAVGRCEPVRCSRVSGAYPRSGWRGTKTGEDRTPV